MQYGRAKAASQEKMVRQSIELYYPLVINYKPDIVICAPICFIVRKSNLVGLLDLLSRHLVNGAKLKNKGADN